MDNIQKSIHHINKTYNHLSYFDVYGGSVLVCILMCTVLVLYFTYMKIQLKAEPIRNNWAVNRCRADVIPFAGHIVQPKNVGWLEFTSNNFKYCMNTVLSNIVGHFVSPIQNILMPILSVWKFALKALQNIRNMFNLIRIRLQKITGVIMGRIINIMVPIQKMVISLRDFFAKIRGVAITALYAAIGGYMTLKSALGAALEMMIIILIALTVLIIICWLVPWWWGVAATLTTMFVGAVIPLAIIAAFLENGLGVRSSLSIPRTPQSACFDERTILMVLGKGPVPICDINVGDVLEDGASVTSTMVLKSMRNHIYDLGGVFVTGEHYVKFNGEWIRVKDHPLATGIIYDKPFVYCVNTTSKHIIVNNILFSDWDDLYTTTHIFNYNTRANNTECSNREHLGRCVPPYINPHDPANIHLRFDGGLAEDTMVHMVDGTHKRIADIEINDTLINGGIVTGTVTVRGDDLRQSKYDLGGSCAIVASQNIVYYSDEFQRDVTTLSGQSIKISSIPRPILYHIMTSDGSFVVGDLTIRDYNTCVDFIEL